MADSGAQEMVRRRRGRAALVALFGIVLLLLAALWLARKPIATDLIDRELARRGVPARYEVKRMGFRTQRLEGLVIGDPRAPDLTAEWVEVDLRPTFGAPEVRAIRAGGMRLRGRLVDGRLTLGAVDKLLPKPTGAPFRLPDLPVALSDARLALATPAGRLTVAVEGRGNLANGFAGRYVATAPSLAFSGCDLTGTRLRGQVTTQGARPRFTGPIAASALSCGEVALSSLSGALDATLEPALDGWRGDVALASGAARVGAWSATGARGQIDFAGNTARTSGAVRLAALGLAGNAGRAGRAEVGGRYTVEAARAERLDEASPPRATSIRFEGGLNAAGVALASVPELDDAARSVAGTPLEPLVQSLVRAAESMGRSGDLRASLSVATRGGEGSVRIDSAELTGSGAVLRFTGGEGARLTWPGSAEVQVDGRLALTGRGVPQVTAELRQAAPGAPISGLARMEPFEANGTRVALAPVRFEADRFSTRVEASGPLLGGRVEGATLALNGRFAPGGLVLNPGCAPLTFRSLSVSGLELAAASLRLCPAGRALVADGRVAGVFEAPRLRGTLGSSPITLAASRARFDGSDFRITDLVARLGSADRASRLDVAQLSGSPGNGVGGRFTGASGQIGKVPLIVSEGGGRWRFVGGLLTVSGAITVSDEPDPARFDPLVARDFALHIRGQNVAATATLREPESGTEVAEVALRHDLGSGVGSADLDVDGIRFAPDGLQPEEITRLTLGVIANVDGSLKGQGRIGWSPEAVTSAGQFRIEAASLAAPFGPVTGVATDIRFTDLLGLVTAPNQRLTVATVNPGILVEQGVVSFRILPDFKVAVESARWPFAGGELTLRPTVLDFSEDAARELTFDIRGLEAARFINKLEFSNINATGIFDGTLPMVFDQDGGRIVGGTLVSRTPGGTLSYIGQVSNADLGIWGGIAFDALKSIAYQRMTIDLTGEIDGEMVSQIRFAGVSRGTIQPVATGLIARIGGQLATELQRLPFIFNIQIRAPFRGLIAMTRSFDDPSLLIQDQLGPQFEAVQPSSSEDKR
jgi:translocation and assembly module TamB